MPRVMLLSDATGAPNCAGVSAPSIAARIEDGCPCDRGTSAARQFGEEIPDHDGRIQVLAFERHGVPAVLHRIQNDHGATVFQPGKTRFLSFSGRRQPSRGGTSRMMREYHVRICERLG